MKFDLSIAALDALMFQVHGLSLVWDCENPFPGS